MNAISQPSGHALDRVPLLGTVAAAWRSITHRQLLTALAFGLGVGLVMGLTSLEVFIGEMRPSALQTVVMFVAMPVATSLVCLLCWAVADHGEREGIGRWRRLAVALVIASLFSAWVLPRLLFDGTGVTERWEQKAERMRAKGMRLPTHFLEINSTLNVLIFGGLAFTLIEVRRRRRETSAALTALTRQRALLARRVFESRLAAMQAQVEPQFLFNTLVDIEALYQRDPASAARILDDLINYLRVALPRLRETGATSGSRLADEIGLVRAYLEVVAARHDGRPQARFVVEPDCADACFYPMLLLPLVQRGVRGAEPSEPPPADRVEISAKRVHDDIFIALRVHAAGLCDEHPELQRVRERLEGLYAGRAALYCGEPKPGITDFTLRIPFDTQ